MLMRSLYYVFIAMKKRLLIVGFVLVLLAAIPLTVYLLQRQQETRSRATPATVLSLSSPTGTLPVGQETTLDITVKPGSNQVSVLRLQIAYDSTKLATSGAGIQIDSNVLPVILQGPIYTQGNITISLTTGGDATKLIQTDTVIGRVTFRTLAGTGSTPTQVTLGTSKVFSAVNAPNEPGNENVLSTTNPASITIAGGNTAATPTPTGVATTPGTNQPPVCTNFAVDRLLTGTAPYSLTFTVSGSDPDGTISKAIFDFGDGPQQEVTQSGGIGSNSVSVPMSHTYNNPGTFTAKGSLVDEKKLTSLDNAACTKTIVVNVAPSGTQPTQAQGPVATPTSIAVISPTSVVNPTEIPTRGPITTTTGPGEVVVAAGIGGFILSIIGVALLFAL